MISEEDIIKLQKKHPDVLIAHGGDGTLAKMWPKAVSAKKLKPIWPIRDYGLCEKHQAIFEALVNDNASLKEVSFKQTLHSLAEVRLGDNEEHDSLLALNEIQLKSRDITEALRFDVHVNGKKYYENVIADGVVFSTPNGATGYWKSLTRTIFRDGCGLAFIAPTVGISSLVLKHADSVKIVLVRNASMALSYDKTQTSVDANRGFELDLRIAPGNLPLIGYEHFMCYECRKNRNSTILQDQYIV